MHPLIPEKALSFSASLAATIGLEEAILLTWLSDIAQSQSGEQWSIDNALVRKSMAFWHDEKIRLVFRSLHEKGLIQLLGPLFPDAQDVCFSFTPITQQVPQQTHHKEYQPRQASFAPQEPSLSRGGEPANKSFAQPMQAQWQPSRDALGRLAQHGIPESYSLSQMDAFMLQASEQGNNRNDWDTQFFRYVKKHWVYTQTDAHKKQQRLAEKAAFNTTAPDRQQRFNAGRAEASPMAQQWQPSVDAQQILQRAGIEPQFILESVPEFVLYWQERGDAHKTWNTKFIQHVRQQWARYSSSLEHASVPTRMSDDWQPDNDCYDILTMAHIDKQFAHNLIGEFVLYWRDSNQLQTSWNSKFLQYVKQQWARQLNQGGVGHAGSQGNQNGTEPGYTTAAAARQRLSDTSWAE